MRYSMRQTVRGLVGVGLLGVLGCGSSAYIATSQLTGANQTPAVTTNANGLATATLDGSELTLQGTFNSLGSDLHEVDGSSVHVHQGAQGVSGPIVFGLKVTSVDQRNGSFSSTLKLDSAQTDSFKKGLFYVNVHSMAYPNGELRGQLIPVEQN